MKNYKNTREVINYSLKYISGDTLDLGAGSAKYRNIIKKQADKYTTFDLVPGNYIDKIGDINNTGYEANCFDTVICTQVFEHIPKPWLAVIEIHRVLKPGGYCVITAPFIQPYHADPYDYYRYTVNGMKALFIEGFEIIEAGPYTKLFSTFVEMLHHTVFSPYKKSKPGSALIIKYLQKVAVWFDKFLKVGRIYSNVYLIARKK